MIDDIETGTASDDGDVDEDEERRVLRKLIAGRMLRRRRVRRAILAHLLRGEDDGDDADDGDDERQVAGWLVGARLGRRRRARRGLASQRQSAPPWSRAGAPATGG